MSALVLRDALGRLGPRYRDVIVQVYFFGRSTAETAGVLGIAQGTVKSRLSDARRMLRSALTESELHRTG